jgi:4-amino-4-deoxy-L-arabinose transferase-like glycosyltransferase
MNTRSATIPWQTLADKGIPVLIALVFLAFTFSYYPFREKLQFDTDEGLNLMRSMLVEMGHPLYSETSSDQPPLFNQILALVFRLVGFNVNAARMLVLLFSTLLVWSCTQFVQYTWGNLSAIAFLPLVIMVPRYLDLSVAVMIGVPAIALAAISMLFVVVWHRSRRDVWLILSGSMLALSVLIKLFTGFLALILLVGITLAAYAESREKKFSWRMFRPALVWGLSFSGLGVFLGLVLVGPWNLPSILLPHLSAPSQEYFQEQQFGMNVHLQGAVPLLGLGALGVVLAVIRRNWLALYPLAWAGLAYLLFTIYTPVFYHHQLLITIPAAMLAAGAVGEGMLSLLYTRGMSGARQLESLLGVAAVIGLVWAAVQYVPVLDKELMNRPRLTGFDLRATSGKLKVLRIMNANIDQTKWIMTDMPMYAFRVGRPVPPNLATFSQKRLSTGSLTDQDILAALRDYRPEQVLIARFQIPAVEEYVQEHYKLILSVEFFRLFLRNDLQPIDQ